MNEMFTERARKAIEFARDEASRLRHDYIGTEHLLLGLIRLGEGRAVEILTNLGIELPDLKASVEEVVQPSGGTMTMGQLPLTARAKKTLEVSGQEARALKSKDIDTEHLLLALLEQPEGVASEIMIKLDADIAVLKGRLDEILRASPKASLPRGGAGQIFITPRVKQTFDQANREASTLKDEYISTEHILLGIASEHGTPTSRLLRDNGVTKQLIYDAIKDIRGDGE